MLTHLAKVLNSWKVRRLLPLSQLEAVVDSLQAAIFAPSHLSETDQQTQQTRSFSRNDILRRVEDDRERHKRLRERIWVLPVPSLLEISANPRLSTVLTTTSTNSPASPASPAQAGEPKLVSLAGYAKENASDTAAASKDSNNWTSAKESALDVEFDQAWDMVGDAYDGPLLEADLQAMDEENAKYYG